MFTPHQERAPGESQGTQVPDIINAKYEELQSARRMKMELEKQATTPMIPSEAQKLVDDIRKLELVIPQLEQEFEALKGSRATDLEKKYGTSSANEDTLQAPLVAGSNDDLLNQRLEGDERKFA